MDSLIEFTQKFATVRACLKHLEFGALGEPGLLPALRRLGTHLLL